MENVNFQAVLFMTKLELELNQWQLTLLRRADLGTQEGGLGRESGLLAHIQEEEACLMFALFNRIAVLLLKRFQRSCSSSDFAQQLYLGLNLHCLASGIQPPRPDPHVASHLVQPCFNMQDTLPAK